MEGIITISKEAFLFMYYGRVFGLYVGLHVEIIWMY